MTTFNNPITVRAEGAASGLTQQPSSGIVFVPLSEANLQPVLGQAYTPGQNTAELLQSLQDALEDPTTQELSNIATLDVISNSIIQALSPLQYQTLLEIIIPDLKSRFGIAPDPLALTYKMIQPKDLPGNVLRGAIEISTTTSSDAYRIRFYFDFSQETHIRFVRLISDQNYNTDVMQSSMIYLYEGTVSASVFASLANVIQSNRYASTLPSSYSLLLTEQGSPAYFTTEDGFPISLEF